MYFWNSWAAVFGLFLAFSFNVLHVQGVWINNWDETFEFSCGDFEFLKVIVSYHSNGAEDRRFFLQCGKLPITVSTPKSTPICSWTEYVNQFKRRFEYNCDDTGYVAGMHSYHDDDPEDRRYKFYCCNMPKTNISDCNPTQDYVNAYDEIAAYIVPDDKILIGMSTLYSRRGKDRRFKFTSCSMSYL